MILDRSLVRQVLATTGAVALVLLLIFLTNRLVRYLAEAAVGDLSREVVFQLIALKSASYLIVLMPLAFYLALLLVLGRMYRDGEMYALWACGVGPGRLYRPLYMVGLPLTLVMLAGSLWGLPLLSAAELTLLEKAARNVEVSGISAGRFREGEGGRRVFYTERMDDDGLGMENVFVYAEGEEREVVLSARRGHIEAIPGSDGDRYLVLEEGWRHEGRAGEADYRLIRFREHRLLVQQAEGGRPRIKRNAIPTAELWGMDGLRNMAELQWRLTSPLVPLALAFVAVPMSRTRPRQGAYGRVVLGVVFYFVYTNLMVVARAWLEKGEIPPWLGLWWVHLLPLAIGGLMIFRAQGWRRVRGRSA